jgi:hypothetical protein
MLSNQESFGLNTRFVIGVVEAVDDPLALGRARVRFFGVHPEDRSEVPTTSLPWATVIAPTTSASNSGVGMSIQLMAGSWVLGFFADGEECQQPWVIGTIPGLHRPNAPQYTSGHIGEPGQDGGITSRSAPYHSDGKQVNAYTGGTSDLSNNQTVVDKANSSNFKLQYYTWGAAPAGFACKDGQASLQMHWGTAQAFELLTSKLGNKQTINSAYRTPAYNARQPGAAANSQHIQGRAIDVSRSTLGDEETFLKHAVESGFVGFGFYDSFIHIDTAHGRVWQQGAGGYNLAEKRAKLSKYGWRDGLPGFSIVKGGTIAQNNPSTSTDPATTGSNPRGPRLDGATATGTPDFMKGFKDPTNSFPLLEYRGRVSTHPNTIGIGFDNNQLKTQAAKESGRATGFMLPKNQGTFGEPTAPAAPQYPWNRTWTSLSHLIEMDDTPGAERVNIESKGGAFVEMDKNGSMVKRAPADMHEYAGMNGYYGYAGSLNHSANGPINSYAGTDQNQHANGNLSVKVGNDGVLEINGSYRLSAGQDVRIKTGKVYIEADEIHFLAASKMCMESKGEMHIKGKSIHMQADEGLDVKGKDLKVTASAGMDIKGNATKLNGTGSLDIKGGTTKIKSDGNLALKGTNTQIGGTKISLSGTTQAGEINSTQFKGPLSGGTGNPDAPADADSAGDAGDATKALMSDLGEVKSLERVKITNAPTYDSGSLSRPSYASHGSYGSTGKVLDAAGASGSQSQGSAGYPSPSTGKGGANGDEGVPESYGQPATPAPGDDPSLFTPEGVQKYVNDFSYKKLTKGSVSKPGQELINGFAKASKKTGYPLDMLYLVSAYESGFNVGAQNGAAKGPMQVQGPYLTDAQTVNGDADNSSSYGSAMAVAGYYAKYKGTVEKQIGHQMTRGEAYILHMCGIGAGPVLMKKGEDSATRDTPIDPNALPGGASTVNGNHGEFYKSDNVIRTYGEFLNRQNMKFGDQYITAQARQPQSAKAGF